MKSLYLALILMAAGLASAADRITLTITVTNLPVTGDTLTNNSKARYWTNALTTGTILTNAAGTTNNYIQRAATNLFTALVSFPASGFNLIPGWGSPTQITLLGQVGEAVTAEAGGTWCDLTLTTQTVTRRYSVDVPMSAANTPAQTTNVASLLVTDLSQRSTNAFSTNSQAMVSYTPTNGTFRGVVSNSAAIGGNVYRLSNGWFRTPLLDSASLTSSVNYGNAFKSPGVGANSDQFGNGATATNTSSFAAGTLSKAHGNSATAVGAGATAFSTQDSAFGAGASADGFQTTSIGYGAYTEGREATAVGANSRAAYTNSAAIGANTEPGDVNEFILGNGSNNVIVPGVFSSAAQTNSTLKGTNQLNGSLGITLSAIATIADGNNTIAIPDGVTFVSLTGAPTATWTNCSMSGTLWDGRLLILDNGTGQNMTIAHESGFDGTAARRLLTSTAADVITTGRRVTIWIYNSTTARWLLIMGG